MKCASLPFFIQMDSSLTAKIACRSLVYILKFNHARCFSSTSKDADYCLNVVRKFDYENFVSTLLLPEGSRAAGFALRAFNIELAQIKDVVSDSKIGLMRIEFWKNCVDQIYGGSAPHSPLAMELLKAVGKHKLTKRWLQRVIEARVTIKKAMCLISYAFPCAVSSGVRNVQADHAASHIGKAHGFVTLIRAMPYHARRNNVYLPFDLMIKHQVSQEDVTRGCREQKMKDLTYDIASEAHKHLSTAETFKDLPPAAFPALLHAVSTRSFLKAIQRVDFDPFDPRLQLRNNWLPLVMWLSKVRRTF